MSRLVPHFGENTEDLAATLFEIGADGAVHRAALSAEIRLADSGRHDALLARQAREPTSAPCVSRARHARRRWDGKAGAAQGRDVSRAGTRAVFRPILNKLGLDQLELVISAGAPLPAETMALWHIYGVNVVEVVRPDRNGGAIIAGQRGPFPRPGDVGTILEGWQVRLGDDGEVLVQRPGSV